MAKSKRSKRLKSMTLDELKDKHIGKPGTEKRENYEFELQLDLVGEMIKKARKDRNLTQEQLGKLIGVQKAQISKLENGSTNITLTTMLRVFDALKAKIKFQIELGEEKLALK